MGITKETIGLAATLQATQPIEERKQPPSQLPSLAFNTFLAINSAIDTAEATAIASKVSAEARLAKDQQDFKKKVDGLITPKMRALSFMAPQLAGVIRASDTKVEYFAREQELQHQKVREAIFEHQRLMLRSNYGSTEDYRAAIDPVEKEYFGDYEPSPEYKVRKEAEYKTLQTYYNQTTEGEKRAAKIKYRNTQVEGAQLAISLEGMPLRDAATRLIQTIQQDTKDSSVAIEALEALLSSHSNPQEVEEVLGSIKYFDQDQKQAIIASSKNAWRQALGLNAGQKYTSITASRDANNSGRYYEGGPTGDPETDRRNALYKTQGIKGAPHQVIKDFKEGKIKLPEVEIERYAANYADKARNRLEDLVAEQNILTPAEMSNWTAPITPIEWDAATGSLMGQDANAMGHKRVVENGVAIKASQGFAPEIKSPYTSAQIEQSRDNFKAHKGNRVAQRAIMDNIWEAINEENKKYSAVFPQGVVDPGHVLEESTGSPYAKVYALNELIKKGKGAAIFDQLTLLEQAPGNMLAKDFSSGQIHMDSMDKHIEYWFKPDYNLTLAHYRQKSPEILDDVVRETIANTTRANGGNTAFHEKARKPGVLETYIQEQIDDSFDFYTGYSPTGVGVPLIIPKYDTGLRERFESQIKKTEIPVLGNLHDVFNDPKTSKYAYLTTNKDNRSLAEVWIAVGNTLSEIDESAKRGIYKMWVGEDENRMVMPNFIDGSSTLAAPKRK